MFKEILLPINMEDTELNARAIAMAEELSERYGARLTVFTATPDFGSSMVASYFPDDALEKAYKSACADLGKFVDTCFKNPAKVHREVGEGSPRKLIVRYVEEHAVDLVVMPARKTNLGKVILGSNSSYVVEHAPCSVLVVRP
jgi:nucleotide-binding universal stress UspA family protein